MTEVCSAGFPHSDICGSMDICSSPQLFAAYHVFLRLLVPRHPPCALSSLTSLAQCIALHRLVVFLFLVFSDVLIKIFLSFSRFIQYAVFKVRSCAFLYSHLRIGRHSGDKGIRTPDPLLARQVLSQLSYIPVESGTHLLSHAVSSIVPSAAQVLTVVFGMGTGVSPERIGTRNSRAYQIDRLNSI